MFHLELFSSSIATGANTFAQLTYVSADAIMAKLNNGMQVSTQLPNLAFVAGVGVNLVHVRAQAPSMLPFPYTAFSPNNRGAGFESPPRVWDMFRTPLPLRPTEELDIFATQNAAGAQVEYVAVQLSDGQITPIPAGRYFTVHGTSATTLTAGAWTQCSITWDQAFPAGYYACCGFRAFSATGLFFRLFPQVAPLWRPGSVAVQAYDQLDAAGARYMNYRYDQNSNWGVWLNFYNNTPPSVEMFATAADTAEEVWMDCVQISGAVTQGP